MEISPVTMVLHTDLAEKNPVIQISSFFPPGSRNCVIVRAEGEYMKLRYPEATIGPYSQQILLITASRINLSQNFPPK